MAIFFFVVGLEIKRELLHGELSSVRRASLPVLAAIGGMVVPALTYLAFNPSGEAAIGWGIPMATDIAFAIGVLALLGRRIPAELRVFLLGLAVVDDLGAITVIAVFYTETIEWSSLLISMGFFAAIIVAVRLGVRSMVVYIVLGVLMWVSFLESGIHATLVGVLLAAIVPSKAHSNNQDTESPLESLEHMIHPWASLAILPLFALANAGIAVTGDTLSDAAGSGVTLGVAAGLLVGKSVGILGVTWLAVRFGVGRLPSGVTWPHVLGVGFLAGIGFTVAIFISGIAFADAALVEQAKMGIFGASVLAAVIGYGILRLTGKADVV